MNNDNNYMKKHKYNKKNNDNRVKGNRAPQEEFQMVGNVLKERTTLHVQFLDTLALMNFIPGM